MLSSDTLLGPMRPVAHPWPANEHRCRASMHADSVSAAQGRYTICPYSGGASLLPSAPGHYNWNESHTGSGSPVWRHINGDCAGSPLLKGHRSALWPP